MEQQEKVEFTPPEALEEFTIYQIVFAAVNTLNYITGPLSWPSNVNASYLEGWRTREGQSELHLNLTHGHMV